MTGHLNGQLFEIINLHGLDEVREEAGFFRSLQVSFHTIAAEGDGWDGADALDLRHEIEAVANHHPL